MSIDLRIKPLDDGKTRNRNPMVLPTPQFSMSVIGGKGVGKTSLIGNLLINPNFFRGVFERIIIFSPTIRADDKWEIILNEDVLYKPKRKKETDLDPKKEDPDRLKINKGDIHTEPEEYVTILKDLRKTYKEIYEEDGKSALPRTLIILDDVLGLKVLSDKTLVNFIANCRHLNCSVIISVQRYNGIPKTIRVNCTYLIIYPTYDKKELKSIYEENSSRFSFNEFSEMIMELFESSERRFLAINNQNPPSHRFIDTFEAFILKGK